MWRHSHRAEDYLAPRNTPKLHRRGLLVYFLIADWIVGRKVILLKALGMAGGLLVSFIPQGTFSCIATVRKDERLSQWRAALPKSLYACVCGKLHL
ncbi:hypothetical protein Micbo1qcDRAFT_163799 [Microdochium bolleyi]|uniref:Uncharacterized protein n=1 Tax=Microdochium bolleyi TaxID=196109 RepID=A0A136J1I6_9PEZI|nr:hypothetical protein Micbo1qcDRAFT_163799 [Microdochium bolleyi]